MFDGWRDDVLASSPPVLYPIGTGDLARIEIGPKLLDVAGALDALPAYRSTARPPIGKSKNPR